MERDYIRDFADMDTQIMKINILQRNAQQMEETNQKFGYSKSSSAIDLVRDNLRYKVL